MLPHTPQPFGHTTTQRLPLHPCGDVMEPASSVLLTASSVLLSAHPTPSGSRRSTHLTPSGSRRSTHGAQGHDEPGLPQRRDEPNFPHHDRIVRPPPHGLPIVECQLCGTEWTIVSGDQGMDRDYECRNNRCSFCDVPLVGKGLGKGRSARSRPHSAGQSGAQRSALSGPHGAGQFEQRPASSAQEHVQHGQGGRRPASSAQEHMQHGQEGPFAHADSSGNDGGEPANWHNLQRFLEAWIEANRD